MSTTSKTSEAIETFVCPGCRTLRTEDDYAVVSVRSGAAEFYDQCSSVSDPSSSCYGTHRSVCSRQCGPWDLATAAGAGASNVLYFCHNEIGAALLLWTRSYKCGSPIMHVFYEPTPTCLCCRACQREVRPKKAKS